MPTKPISAPPVARSTGSVDPLLSALTAANRPARWNNASVCIYCMTRWCAEQHCVDMHSRSVWIVCEKCDGFDVGCSCVGGVVEAYAARLDSEAHRVLSIEPPEDFEI